jgi:hypothetical protein
MKFDSFLFWRLERAWFACGAGGKWRRLGTSAGGGAAAAPPAAFFPFRLKLGRELYTPSGPLDPWDVNRFWQFIESF